MKSLFEGLTEFNVAKIEEWQFHQRQALSLEIKERYTEIRIRAWYEYWKGEVYVSFSGGKDSTVLLHQVRRLYPNVLAVFIDTGLEYPEIRDFVKTIDSVEWVKPKMNFREVIEKYGYPIISKENAQKIDEIRNTKSDKLRSKRLFGDANKCGKLPGKWQFCIDADFKISSKCCDALKKRPVTSFEKRTGLKPYLGMMAMDSFLRKTAYLLHGCNAFEARRPKSNPMAFWREENVWEYIHKHGLSYCSIYDKGYTRTGCMFCMFGVHLEKGENRFQLMKRTHPTQYNYCINKLGCGKVLDYIGVSY